MEVLNVMDANEEKMLDPESAVDFANAMIALRCAHENDEAGQFHERRHRENIARLEAYNGRNGQPPKRLAA